MTIDWGDPNLKTKGDGYPIKHLYTLETKLKFRHVVVISFPDHEMAELMNDEGMAKNFSDSYSAINPPKEEWVNVWTDDDGMLACSRYPYSSEAAARAPITDPSYLSKIATVRIK